MNSYLSTLHQLLYSTVRVEVESDAGKAVGTGFFSSFPLSNENSVLVLVGTKHLLEGSRRIEFWVNLAGVNGGPSRQYVRARIESDGDAAFLHPNPDTDLAAVVVSHVMRQLEERGQDTFYRHIPDSLIPTPSQWELLDAGDEIVMMGCPWGIHDEVNKLPLARKGALASYPALDFNGKPEFVVDIASFEGSSGSPIFLNSFLAFNPTTGEHELKARSLLLGILKRALEVKPESQAADDEEAGYALHLGLAIKSSELRGLFEQIRNFATAVGE